MKGSFLASRPGSLVCPLCETGQLRPSAHHSVRCESCGAHLGGPVLEALRQIADLPDVLGEHACECGHPQMRLLPDGTYHCPACGSEVLPVGALAGPSKPEGHGRAYWAGWMDGRFRKKCNFADNPNLANWENPPDRLDYYRGHRAGSEDRRAGNGRKPDARERLSG